MKALVWFDEIDCEGVNYSIMTDWGPLSQQAFRRALGSSYYLGNSSLDLDSSPIPPPGGVYPSLSFCHAHRYADADPYHDTRRRPLPWHPGEPGFQPWVRECGFRQPTRGMGRQRPHGGGLSGL